MDRALYFGERAVQLAEDAALAEDPHLAQQLNELASEYAALAVEAFDKGKSVTAALAFLDRDTRTRLASMTTRLTGLRRRYAQVARCEDGLRSAA